MTWRLFLDNRNPRDEIFRCLIKFKIYLVPFRGKNITLVYFIIANLITAYIIVAYPSQRSNIIELKIQRKIQHVKLRIYR